MEQNKRNSWDDGVSESIGFLLIFTIVIMGIGLVTLYGYPMLLQQQTGADEQIMEKNMIVLQNDFKSLAYKTVPYKETSLKIGGGSLAVNSLQTTGPTFQVNDGGGSPLMDNNKTGELLYQASASQTEISLQNGAVVKMDPSVSGSVMLAQPRWFYDDNTGTMVINIICINSSEYISRAGIGTVQMELGPTDYFKMDYSPGTSPINIVYTPVSSTHDYTTAWKTYFERSMKMTCAGGTWPTPLTCTKTLVKTIVIKRTEVIINTL
jgi:hypothetical protein